MSGPRFHMAKSHLRVVAPTEILRTVPPRRGKNAELRTREHFTPDEVEALMEAARGRNAAHTGVGPRGRKPAQVDSVSWAL
jgi:hypothetical protein